MWRSRLGALVGATVLVLACGGGGGGGGGGGRGAEGTSTNTMTQRQRDSALGASRIPGAGGVRKALEASDSAAARNARLDSIH